MPLIRHFSLLQLLQRFRLEYHHEPLDLRQKLLTVPDQPVKIKFVDRGWLYPVSLLFVLVVSDGSFLTFFNSRTSTQSHTPTVVQGEGVDGTPSPLGFLYVAVFRGGEWYLEKRGSRKILVGSRNLGSVFDKSRSIVSSWFVFTFYESRNFLPKSLGLGFSN